MKHLFKNTLFSIKGFPMDAFIRNYLDIISDRMEPVPTLSGPIVYDFVKGMKGTRQPERIREKCLFLLDAIIRKCLPLSSDGFVRECPLNAKILKSVIREDYKALIITLCHMGFLSFGPFEIGAHSRLYILSGEVEFEIIEVVSKKIYDYKQKTLSEIDKLMKENTYPLVESVYGKGFLTHYLSSLNAIKLEDEDGFNQYEKRAIADNPSSYVYFRYIYSELKNRQKVIYKIDAYSGANRLYHILTNLKKEVKQYLNISCSLDASNSQPLLFNLLLFNYYNLSYNISYKLFNYFSLIKEDIFHYRYDSASFIKYLKKNYLEFSFFAKIKPDVLWYMFLTATGKLWDWLSEKTEVERDELKKEMFEQVFYSNKSRVSPNQKLAILFKEYFPTVLKQIQRWKLDEKPDDIMSYIDEHEIHPKSKNGYLAIAMQQLESEIMGTILTKLYRKRYKAVNIHDCIVIPKTRGKQPSREEVLTIMNDVYQSFGLVATFK